MACFSSAKLAADVFCVLVNVTSQFIWQVREGKCCWKEKMTSLAQMMWLERMEDMLNFHQVDLYNIFERHYLFSYTRVIWRTDNDVKVDV